MTRTKLRENLYIMLFQSDFHGEEDLSEQAEMYLEDLEGASKKAKTELKERFEAVISNLPAIDAKIEEKAEGWTVSRMAKADLTVMRLAVFEILFDESVPNGVAINEAVNLAKIYGTEKASGFINGVLASIVRELPEKE